MDRDSVLQAQADRTLAEIGLLQRALDAGSLVSQGSMGQPVGNKLLAELRQHRLLLLRLLGVAEFGPVGPVEDELDRLRSDWESHGP